MQRIPCLLLALAAALPVSAFGQSATVGAATAKASNVRIAGTEVEVRAKVVELDMARRLATLRGPGGKLVTVDVPADVNNFEQVQVGDELVVRYLTAIAAKLEKASKSGIRERVETTATAGAAQGALPGTAAGRTVEVLATIQALDRKAGTATLRGVKRLVTLRVPEGIDIAKLKVGDEVRAVFVEAAVLSVERAPTAKATKPAR